MITLEEACEQLLSQIELELCHIYDAQSKAPKNLMELYDHISELPLSNPIFVWYRVNADKVRIEYANDEVRIYKVNEDDSPENFIHGVSGTYALDDLIDQAFGNEN